MALTPLPFYLVNAFTTNSPHSGNQAGVVIFPADDPRSKDDAYQLNVAKDIYYSETAFLVPVSPGRWGLRWWTPESVRSSLMIGVEGGFRC
jgi:predicted PhzF superfamily epimerase YddE/YHI9